MGRTTCTEPQCLYKGALLTLRNVGYDQWQDFFKIQDTKLSYSLSCAKNYRVLPSGKISESMNMS